ncbi:MAG: hypothetical protein R3F22_09580 [Lysobacteraceae bacterium]
MPQRERRSDQISTGRELKDQLNEDQRYALVELERFGWELKFIRRPLFQPMVTVLFDGDRSHYAVLETDGTLTESPEFDIRH